MKLSILFSTSFVWAAAAATKGIHHLHQTPVPRKDHTLDIFQSVVDVLEQCSAKTTALAECYGGDTPMLAYVVSEPGLESYTIRNDIAVADYQLCVDNHNSTCNDERSDNLIHNNLYNPLLHHHHHHHAVIVITRSPLKIHPSQRRRSS